MTHITAADTSTASGPSLQRPRDVAQRDNLSLTVTVVRDADQPPERPCRCFYDDFAIWMVGASGLAFYGSHRMFCGRKRSRRTAKLLDFGVAQAAATNEAAASRQHNRRNTEFHATRAGQWHRGRRCSERYL